MWGLVFVFFLIYLYFDIAIPETILDQVIILIALISECHFSLVLLILTNMAA